jgi:hypothetical protein
MCQESKHRAKIRMLGRIFATCDPSSKQKENLAFKGAKVKLRKALDRNRDLNLF